MTNPTRETKSGGAGVDVLSGASASTLPATEDTAEEPRWCRFADIWCRCTLDDTDSAVMSACASHFVREAVGR